MKMPFIILVDDDEHVLRAIRRDVLSRYKNEYRVIAAASGSEALEVIKELKLKNETAALFISDQRMPEMEGTAFLEQANEIYPEAKMVLLTAYSDTEVAIKAINKLKLNYYLLKPWNPPEEKLYPVIDDLLFEWQAQYKPDHEGLKIIGFQWSPKSHTLKEFLSGNLIPYQWMDYEHNPEAEKYVKSTGVNGNGLPLVVLKDGRWFSDPELPLLAQELGLQQTATQKMYDVLIIGAGPAGLAASVYGSCEGLKTILVEKSNPGGQASSSARIENYLGFPNGLSGAELTRRAMTQTLRFGTEVLTPKTVKNIRVKDGYKVVEMTDGSEVHSRTVIISSGVQYAKLNIPGLEKFAGAGVYYGSASVEAHACRDKVVYIIGGGNSACQAALYICNFAREVNIVIRKDALKNTAANYLVEGITKTPNIKVMCNTELTAVDGNNVLKQITLRNTKSGAEETFPTRALFIYIGAKPGTSWLNNIVLKDENGHILTGNDVVLQKSFNTFWKLDRKPYICETSVPGIFASGDVRSSALTGISSAVGEGAMAVRFVRKYLQET